MPAVAPNVPVNVVLSEDFAKEVRAEGVVFVENEALHGLQEALKSIDGYIAISQAASLNYMVQGLRAHRITKEKYDVLNQVDQMLADPGQRSLLDRTFAVNVGTARVFDQGTAASIAKALEALSGAGVVEGVNTDRVRLVGVHDSDGQPLDNENIHQIKLQLPEALARRIRQVGSVHLADGEFDELVSALQTDLGAQISLTQYADFIEALDVLEDFGLTPEDAPFLGHVGQMVQQDDLKQKYETIFPVTIGQERLFPQGTVDEILERVKHLEDTPIVDKIIVSSVVAPHNPGIGN